MVQIDLGSLILIVRFTSYWKLDNSNYFLCGIFFHAELNSSLVFDV